jgi:hypothetical protein
MLNRVTISLVLLSIPENVKAIQKLSIFFSITTLLTWLQYVRYGSPESLFNTTTSFKQNPAPIPVPSAFKKASFAENLAAKC